MRLQKNALYWQFCQFTKPGTSVKKSARHWSSDQLMKPRGAARLRLPQHHARAMQAKSSSSTPSRTTHRAGRPLPPRRRLNTERLHAGIAWVLRWLVCQRHGLNVAWLAREAPVGDQSLRDYLDFKHPEGWHTESRVALVLGYFPDELERLTRRWMRKYRHREQRRHAGEKDWRLRFPWEQGPPVEKPPDFQPLRPSERQQKTRQSDPG